MTNRSAHFMQQQLVKLGLLNSGKHDEAMSELAPRAGEVGTVQYS